MISEGPVLKSEHIALVPLTTAHSVALQEAASDGKLWNLKVTSVPSEVNVDSYISAALEQKAKGEAMPFVVQHIESNEIIGCTRYCNIAMEHKRLEIGYTWYALRFQRTYVNTECKLLLLTHAFENMHCKCVQFKTHHENFASQKAIERLGAKKDGVLRNDRMMSDGSSRHTYVYSILDSEWPTVKANLMEKLQAYRLY